MKKKLIRLITLSAMLIALSIILTRLSYTSGAIRIHLGNLPIMLAGIWLGPAGGAVVGFIADFIGANLTTGWYPLLSIAPAAIGAVSGFMGRLIFKKKMSWFRSVFFVLSINVPVNMFLATYILSIYLETSFWGLLFPWRLVISLGMSAAESSVITILLKHIGLSTTFLSGREKHLSYEDALAYIHSVSWKGCRPGLARTKELLRRLGSPQNSLKFVHIAGTNGKGSTASMIYSILIDSGIKAGLYTSPFIESFNERINALGSDITDAELAYVTEIVKKQADRMSDTPTEFELITCIAFEYYKRKGVELVVLEVGLGGELDSTNAIDTPEVALITSMSLDHVQILGGTMHEIAAAKAGIIKTGGNVISLGNNKEADDVFSSVAASVGASLRNPDFSLLEPENYGLWGQSFTYKTYTDLKIPLAGKYQLSNAAMAIEAAELLKEKGWPISEENIREGLWKVNWPVRFEVLCDRPIVIVDGSHNPEGASSTAKSIKRLTGKRKLVFIIGVMADKDIDGILAPLTPLASEVFTVTPNNPRAMCAEELASIINMHGIKALSCGNMRDAAKKSLVSAGTNGTVCAIGSLYMAGDIKAALLEEIKAIRG